MDPNQTNILNSLENNQEQQMQAQVNNASRIILNPDLLLGTQQRPFAIYYPPITDSAEMNATPYDGIISIVHPKFKIPDGRSDNINYIGFASTSLGPQEVFSIDNGFALGGFPEVINTDQAFYVTVRVAFGLSLSGLEVSTCGVLVYGQSMGLGVQFVSSDGLNYIRFPLKLCTSRKNSSLQFDVCYFGSPYGVFFSPVFNCYSSSRSSQSGFYKRQNIKVLIGDHSTLLPAPSAVALPPTPHQFALRTNEQYDNSEFAPVIFVAMASAISNESRLVLIGNGGRLEISKREGQYGERLFFIGRNIATTSNLLIRRGIYQLGFYCGNQVETQFKINLFDNSISLNQ